MKSPEKSSNNTRENISYFFPRVFDIANQLLNVTCLSRHSANEQRSFHYSQSNIACQDLCGEWLLKH